LGDDRFGFRFYLQGVYMTESQFWKEIRKCLNRRKYGFQRVEDRYSQGVPDLCIFVNGRTVWVELKKKDLPKRDTTKIKLGIRDRQRMWHEKRLVDEVEVLVVSMCEKDDMEPFYLCSDNSKIGILHEGCLLSELIEISEMFESIDDLVDYITS